MKKILFLSMVLVLSLALFACKEDKYKEEAGVYEAYFMSGDISLSDFEYYTIELKADGDAIVKSKGSQSSSAALEFRATFTIEDGKIIVVTKSGAQTITETYDYIDGEIHMLDVELDVYSFTVKLRRAE